MFRADITYHRDNFNLAVSLQLNKGRITALLGESGSGKSTLFRLLSGLDKPHTGHIYSDQACWFESKENINLAIQKRNVGLVFQDYALFEHLNVEENIAYGVKQGKNALVIKEWLSKTSLSNKATAYPNSLSGGEKQRVALARVLAASPDVLFLDEPFSALDEHLRRGLRRELQTIIGHTKIPVVIATHDLKEARFLAEYVYVMSKGIIIQSGSISDVFNNPVSIQAAKVLGWQNLLSVDSSDQWGKLSLQKNGRNIICVGIPMSALSLKSDNDSDIMLVSTLMHIIDMERYLFLEVKLPNSENLVLQVDASNSLKIGQKLNIYINTSLLVTFNR